MSTPSHRFFSQPKVEQLSAISVLKIHFSAQFDELQLALAEGKSIDFIDALKSELKSLLNCEDFLPEDLNKAIKAYFPAEVDTILTEHINTFEEYGAEEYLSKRPAGISLVHDNPELYIAQIESMIEKYNYFDAPCIHRMHQIIAELNKLPELKIEVSKLVEAMEVSADLYQMSDEGEFTWELEQDGSNYHDHFTDDDIIQGATDFYIYQ